ncbi:hypothetical protein JB92DRAFT_3305157 [Gautieria morchelliformis]|nr:hypothetical protein JB92DRAFT_3305157 [Gautieria morchelliformis]
MYAPVGKHWSLATIRWWGGWAEGEHHEMLIWYLLDELYRYEEGHSDALRQVKAERDRSFLGEHVDGQPPSFDVWKCVIEVQFETLQSHINGTQHCNHPSNSSVPLSANDQQLRCCGEHDPANADRPPSLSRSDSEPEGTLIPYTNTSSAPLNLSIPKIVRSRKGVESLPAWKQAVRDWEAADPQRGHNALKDWRPEWLTGKFKP